MARVLVVEPFYGGSHRAAIDGLIGHSSHEYDILALSGEQWRSRMRRGSIELAMQSHSLTAAPDVLLASDMLDLPAFLALTRPRFAKVPIVLYMHENQFTYPRIRGTKLNSWFGAINYASALAADVCWFNSEHHHREFLDALRTLEKHPNNWLAPDTIDAIEAKSAIVYLGVELAWLDAIASGRKTRRIPLVLWNQRWDFDKSPDMFMRAMASLAAEDIEFDVAIAGEPGPNPHPSLVRAREVLGERLVHHGYAESRQAYGQLLRDASVVVSTTRHEFFGIGMIEAMYAGCVPVAPRAHSYPELLPPALHDELLFEDEAGLLERLRMALSGAPPAVLELRNSAARFEWPNRIQDWDERLESMVLGPITG